MAYSDDSFIEDYRRVSSAKKFARVVSINEKPLVRHAIDYINHFNVYAKENPFLILAHKGWLNHNVPSDIIINPNESFNNSKKDLVKTIELLVVNPKMSNFNYIIGSFDGARSGPLYEDGKFKYSNSRAPKSQSSFINHVPSNHYLLYRLFEQSSVPFLRSSKSKVGFSLLIKGHSQDLHNISEDQKDDVLEERMKRTYNLAKQLSEF